MTTPNDAILEAEQEVQKNTEDLESALKELFNKVDKSTHLFKRLGANPLLLCAAAFIVGTYLGQGPSKRSRSNPIVKFIPIE